MQILHQKTAKKTLLKNAKKLLGGCMLKCVADVEKGVIAVDAEMHFDLEQFLLKNGSKQENLWGFNLYLDEEDPEDLIEFDSLINIRPSQNNRSRYVEDVKIRDKIKEIVDKWIAR